ncbi:MAG: prepilin-type N-terminal cleavage/methylation domain-containing protein [Gemmatimonadaceae bacterium]
MRKRRMHLERRRGVTMIELMVALAIVSVGVFGLAGGATLVTRLMGGGTIQTRAAQITSAHLEQFRSMSCTSVSSSADTSRGVISTWTASGVSSGGARRATSINLTVRYPTTKGMRSQAYYTLIPC